MMRPIPFPILLADRQPHIVRAHRMRSAVVANLIRDFARWVPPPPAKALCRDERFTRLGAILSAA